MKESPETQGFNASDFLDYWNLIFKMPFLRYLNDPSRQSFAIPPSAYSWISQNVTKSFSSFKFDLYDKFAIINLAPNYASNELIWLI